MLLVSSNSFVSDSDLNKILPIQFKKEQKALKETEGGPFKCFCCCCFFNLFVVVVIVNTVFEVINDSSWAAEMHAEESIKAATQGE